MQLKQQTTNKQHQPARQTQTIESQSSAHRSAGGGISSAASANIPNFIWETADQDQCLFMKWEQSGLYTGYIGRRGLEIKGNKILKKKGGGKKKKI